MEVKNRHILFLTTSNLATNPRLVKEMNLAYDSGFEITVCCFEFSNWSKNINDNLIAHWSNKATIITISAQFQFTSHWVIATLREKITNIGINYFPSLNFYKYRDKRTVLLQKKLLDLDGSKFNLIVAHNPGAIIPAKEYAKKYSIPFGYDIEDYHPGETKNEKLATQMRHLFQFELKDAAYLSAASPLILEYSLRDILSFNKQCIVIQNYFPSEEFKIPNPQFEDSKLRVVWFSQNINKGRGIEQIIGILPEFESDIQLYLIGSLNNEFYHQYLKGISNISILDPVSQPTLHSMLATYDIGLAIEPAKDLNNRLAVSNKLNAYIQSGLFVLASDTEGQKKHLISFPGSGEVLNINNEQEIRSFFLRAVKSKDDLRKGMIERYTKQMNINWTSESIKLLHTWKKILV